MYYSVQHALERYTTTWSGTAALATAVSELNANITALEAAVAKQVVDIRGYAKDKAQAEDLMIAVTMKVAGAAKAFATVQGNAVLATQMSASPSALRKFRDAVIALACQGIHDAANAVVADLADYGILPADMTALQDAINVYVQLVGSPRTAITERKSQTSEIGLLVRDTAKLLNNRMDPLVGIFAVSDATFHRAYFDARIIVDHRGGRDSASENPEGTAEAA